MWSLLLNLIAAAIAAIATWSYQKLRQKRLRYRRLRELRESAKAGEIAICVRVGGMGDPVPDVLKYLREYHPDIHKLDVYRVSSREAEDAGAALDDPDMARRIIEDICEGIRAYGEGAVTRVHFFPSGMIVYPMVFGVMINWSSVIVYHKPNNAYAPVYEMSKDWIKQGKREFKPLKVWEVLPVEPASDAPTLSSVQAIAPQPSKKVSAI